MGSATIGIETLISIKQVATATVSNDEQQSVFSSYRGDSNYVSYLCPQQHILCRFMKQLQDNQTQTGVRDFVLQCSITAPTAGSYVLTYVRVFVSSIRATLSSFIYNILFYYMYYNGS